MERKGKAGPRRHSIKIGAAATLACALSLVLTPMLATDANAQGRWCAESGGRGGYQNCGYYTYQQCRAAISGVGGFCRPNYQAEPYDGNYGYAYPPGGRDRSRWR